MAIDPTVWADTPGFGRAPLLADPVVENPMADIARRLIKATGGDNRVLAGDRPVGAILRDVNTMTPQEQKAEYQAYGGMNPSIGQEAAIRAPAAVVGLAALGAGALGGAMANQGVEARIRELAGAMTQGRGGEVAEQVRRAQAMEAGRKKARETLENFGRTRPAVTPRSGPGSPRAKPKPKETGGNKGGTRQRQGGTSVFTRGDTMPI